MSNSLSFSSFLDFCSVCTCTCPPCVCVYTVWLYAYIYGPPCLTPPPFPLPNPLKIFSPSHTIHSFLHLLSLSLSLSFSPHRTHTHTCKKRIKKPLHHQLWSSTCHTWSKKTSASRSGSPSAMSQRGTTAGGGEPSPLPAGPRAVGPSLTLGLPAGAVVKRERAEEAGDEGDMLSSYSAATRAGEMPDDEDGGGNRKKLRLSKEQSALLEDRFKEHSTLNPKQKAALAKQLNLRPRQVEVWFQNRRARTKLKQTEVDYELLKRCCETLTEENRRLHRELQQLRALHRTTPAPPHLYMQFPAATLSICPSCECITPSAADGPKKAAAAPPPPGRAHFFSPFTNSAAC